MKHKITKIFCAAGVFFSSIILLYGYFLNNILTNIAIPDNILHGKTFYILKNNAFIDFPLLKVNTYSAHNPDIITIGSSRVTQFREAFFTRPFVNMGYSVGSIGDMGRLYQILREREREREPALVLFAIDFWWFSDGYDDAILGDPPRWYTSLKYLPVFSTIRECLTPYKRIWQKPRKLQSLVIPLFQDLYVAQKDEQPINEAGSGPDGSTYYPQLVTARQGADVHFRITIQDIQEEKPLWSHVKKINPDHVDKFVANVEKLRSLYKNIIFFFPPLANPVYAELWSRRAEYQHFFLLRQILEEKGVVVYDYSSLSSFGSNDCEMLDGFHGGDVAYARILLHLAAASPLVKGVINEPYLREVTEEFSGNAMIPDKRVTLDPEVDFLELQCVKGRRRSASH